MSLVAVAYLFCISCASTSVDPFSDLKEGMDKDKVLQVIGNPYRTEKSAVKEKWGYRYYSGKDKEKETLKYVEFINGRVSAFGEDEVEMRRLEQLKESEIKRKTLDQKIRKVEDKLNKEYPNK